MDLLPPKLIEEILVKLPHKDLVRFSVVSKSWNLIIFDREFDRKHKNRAAQLGWHRLVIYMNDDWAEAASFCSLAPISSDLRLEVIMKPIRSEPDYKIISFSAISNTSIDARDYVNQFEGKPYFLACCDELWCVEVKKCLYLWNPSMENIIPLPPPCSFESRADCSTWMANFIYGLAYDSVNDDYKVLKIGRHSTEVYSLKNHCWKNMESFCDVRPSFQFEQQKCEFVEGKLHWVGQTAAGAPIIASFDLSTDKYGEVAQPQYDEEDPHLEVVSLRGMLCASVNYRQDTVDGRFVLWAMEEYGVEKSWIKKFDMKLSFFYTCPKKMTPLYLSDNNDLLVKIYERDTDYLGLRMHRNGEECRPTVIVELWGNNYYYEADAFLYVESLITDKNFSKNR